MTDRLLTGFLTNMNTSYLKVTLKSCKVISKLEFKHENKGGPSHFNIQFVRISHTCVEICEVVQIFTQKELFAWGAAF